MSRNNRGRCIDCPLEFVGGTCYTYSDVKSDKIKENYKILIDSLKKSKDLSREDKILLLTNYCHIQAGCSDCVLKDGVVGCTPIQSLSEAQLDLALIKAQAHENYLECLGEATINLDDLDEWVTNKITYTRSQVYSSEAVIDLGVKTILKDTLESVREHIINSVSVKKEVAKVKTVSQCETEKEQDKGSKVTTIADKIRCMTDEELAVFLNKSLSLFVKEGDYVSFYITNTGERVSTSNTEECILELLRLKSKEDLI